MSSGALSLKPRKRRTRAQNSSTSSSAKMLPSDSIGTAWRTLANFSDGARADLAVGRIRVGELGKRRLERGVAAAQFVILGVGNRRRVLAVIAPVVLGDLGPEARMLGPRLGEGELRRFLFRLWSWGKVSAGRWPAEGDAGLTGG